MLVLTRKLKETLRIGNDITITVTKVGKGSVRLGVQAPRDLVVMRGELHEAQQQELAKAK